MLATNFAGAALALIFALGAGGWLLYTQPNPISIGAFIIVLAIGIWSASLSGFFRQTWSSLSNPPSTDTPSPTQPPEQQGE
jgi:hypothetical protein